jgi:hypothetical protein
MATFVGEEINDKSGPFDPTVGVEPIVIRDVFRVLTLNVLAVRVLVIRFGTINPGVLNVIGFAENMFPLCRAIELVVRELVKTAPVYKDPCEFSITEFRIFIELRAGPPLNVLEMRRELT